jgi:hypothetical protein
MSSAPLNHHHRETLDRIFAHPTSGNIEWHAVRSLLEAVGTVEDEHGGTIVVSLEGARKTLHVPHGKDIDEQTIRELRGMLADAQLVPPEVDH